VTDIKLRGNVEVLTEALICTQVILDISKSKQGNEIVQSGISGIRRTDTFVSTRRSIIFSFSMSTTRALTSMVGSNSEFKNWKFESNWTQ